MCHITLPPTRTQHLHRTRERPSPGISDIRCHCKAASGARSVAQFTFHHDRQQIILEQTDAAKGLEDQYIDRFDSRNKPLKVR